MYVIPLLVPFLGLKIIFPISAQKKGLVLEKNELVFRYTFRKKGGGGSDPSVKNVTLFFFNEGFPNSISSNIQGNCLNKPQF